MWTLNIHIYIDSLSTIFKRGIKKIKQIKLNHSSMIECKKSNNGEPRVSHLKDIENILDSHFNVSNNFKDS
uniref:Uncharacterized protein n=1 Tax=Panagrolaimus sp. PS1159 TaxID=55785 RepID=A0AC35G7Z2_9BILA